MSGNDNSSVEKNNKRKCVICLFGSRMRSEIGIFSRFKPYNMFFVKKKKGIWVVDQLLTLDIYVTKQFGKVKGTQI